MFLKICGTTNLPDAELAVAHGAGALGFIFAPSKRRVSLEQAAGILRELPSSVLAVGVFTEPDVTQIVHTVRQTGLTAVQMHWPYQADVVKTLAERLGSGVALWQVVGFPLAPEDEAEALRTFAQTLGAAMGDRYLDVVLLDAVRGKVSGGQGEPFAWRQAEAVVTKAQRAAVQAARRAGDHVPRLALAGGLTAENVGEAIAVLRPWAVDVVSGVEASPGHKDPDRLRRFVEAATAATF